MIKKLTIVKHYDKEDPRCVGDYREIEILTESGESILYGDDYHEKGLARSEGFIDGITLANGGKKPKIIKKSIADWEG